MHWTYRSVADTDLQQGDILARTDELLKLFEEIHPHFCDPKYLAFLVLTQTCDLVRRGGKPCRSRYINLAVVRSLDSVLLDLLDQVCERLGPGIYLRETKPRANQLLERIFGQNEQALGLFYLHPDAEAGVPESAIALLQVSVAFRVQHYDLLLAARRGGLQEEFQAKLGWLVGNLFSRVGTTDWTESKDRQKELGGMLKAFLEDTRESGRPSWISRGEKEALEKAGVALAGVDPGEIDDLKRRHRPISVLEEVVDAVLAVMGRETRLEPKDVERLGNKLRNDALLASALKARVP